LRQYELAGPGRQRSPMIWQGAIPSREAPDGRQRRRSEANWPATCPSVPTLRSSASGGVTVSIRQTIRYRHAMFSGVSRSRLVNSRTLIVGSGTPRLHLSAAPTQCIRFDSPFTNYTDWDCRVAIYSNYSLSTTSNQSRLGPRTPTRIGFLMTSAVFFLTSSLAVLCCSSSLVDTSPVRVLQVCPLLRNSLQLSRKFGTGLKNSQPVNRTTKTQPDLRSVYMWLDSPTA